MTPDKQIVYTNNSMLFQQIPHYCWQTVWLESFRVSGPSLSQLARRHGLWPFTWHFLSATWHFLLALFHTWTF